MDDRSAKIHKDIRQYRPPAFADFMDLVYLKMSDSERKMLSSETGEYINQITAFALKHVSDFGEALAEMVAGVYVQSPAGERFVLDPTRCNEITESCSFSILMDSWYQ